LGDLAGLAASIADLGLLHPIVINSAGELFAGERRLLGWKAVPATVIDLDAIVKGEFAENAHRKDFLPSEIDAIRRALEPIERTASKTRMSDGGKGAKISHPSTRLVPSRACPGEPSRKFGQFAMRPRLSPTATGTSCKSWTAIAALTGPTVPYAAHEMKLEF
jgi:hypothetical protein